MNISIISRNTSVRDSFRERCEKSSPNLIAFLATMPRLLLPSATRTAGKLLR